MTEQGHHYKLTIDMQRDYVSPKKKDVLRQIIEALGRAFTVIETKGTSIVVWAHTSIWNVVGKAKDIVVSICIFANISGCRVVV